MEFVNLYIQSEYSLLHSTVKLNNDFASRLIKDQATSCAIVDNDSMYGAIKFYNLCKVHNIKPIIGLKLSLKSNYSYNNQVLLYAMNYDGYVNLMKLSTIRKSSKSDLNIDALYKYRSGVLAIFTSR